VQKGLLPVIIAILRGKMVEVFVTQGKVVLLGFVKNMHVQTGHVRHVYVIGDVKNGPGVLGTHMVTIVAPMGVPVTQ